MTATSENFNTLFGLIDELEQSKKDLSCQIKDAFNTFVTQYSESTQENKSYLKAIKKAYKEYKELQKDSANYFIVSRETEAIVDAIIPRQ